MPNELRILRFGIEEAEKALRALAPRIDCELPDDAFTAAQADRRAKKPSTLFLTGSDGKTCTVPNGHLAAGLIYYCRTIGVDVASEGMKEIYVARDYVELRTALKHGEGNAQKPGKQAAA